MLSMIQLIAAYSDAVILIICGLSTAVLGVLLAAIARRLWFARPRDAVEEPNKLAEVVHGSLLAFSVFVLALMLADVRVNLARADDAVSREGSYIARLDRDLASLDGSGPEAARKALRDYVGAVTRDEWHSLSTEDAGLSATADRALAALVLQVRKVAVENPDAASSLRGLLDRLEEYRQGRLETATKSVPGIFWWMILVFLLGAMLMNGRFYLNPAAIALIAAHMGAIGMVLGLIIIMDEPFRGESSISSARVSQAIKSLP
ncbi:hypothetical protein BIWAKO_05256 [Bosea sp. BIWAKO-01]|nr:hypothetical protein BIWAKO_05256 [Bosea sp. BIWAKO-01]